jgi:superfamily II DNA or RNA helicase
VVAAPEQAEDVGDLIGVMVPRQDQRDGVAWIMKSYQGKLGGGMRKGVILADDMGVGKTLQALMVAKAQGKHARVLFICPRAVLDIWVSTARAIYSGQSVRALFENGLGATDTIASFMSGAGWLFMTYQYYVLNAAAFGRSGAVIDLLVCDEAHVLCGESERRVVVAAARAKYRLMLTATPVSNDRRELWFLLDMCEPGCVGDSYDSWGWMTAGDAAAGVPATEAAVFVRAWWAEQVQSVVRGLTQSYLLRRELSGEERGIGARHDYIVQVAVSPLQMALSLAVQAMPGGGGRTVSRAHLQHLVATDPALLGTASQPLASIAGVPSIRQLLPTSWAGDAGLTPDKRCPKLALVLGIIRRVVKRDGVWTGDKIVLFASETEPIKQYQEALLFEFKNEAGFRGRQGVYSGSQGDKRLLDAFNDPANPLCVLWVSTKAGGTGITLIGASRAIIFHPTHNPAHDLQAFGRIWRSGQVATVFQYRVVTRDSCDERILLRQMVKNQFARVVFAKDAAPVDMSERGAGSLCDAPREKADVLISDSDPASLQGQSLEALVGGVPVRYLADQLLSDFIVKHELVEGVYVSPRL